MSILRKLIAEFIGVFFLVFTIGMTVIKPGAGDMAPLAISLVLAAMIYSGAHISGSHYHPAVTLIVWLRKKISTNDALWYVAVQLLAGLVAAWATMCLKGHAPLPIVLKAGPALLAEFLGTFTLIYVVLNTAMSKAAEGNGYYGLVIGLTVLPIAFALGPISGGAFNPAVAVGISAMHLTAWQNLWIYPVGEFSGALAAAAIFHFACPDDRVA